MTVNNTKMEELKKLIVLLLALVMVFFLAACGGSAKEEPAETEAAAPDVTHVWGAGVAYYAEKYCKDNDIRTWSPPLRRLPRWPPLWTT